MITVRDCEGASPEAIKIRYAMRPPDYYRLAVHLLPGVWRLTGDNGECRRSCSSLDRRQK